MYLECRYLFQVFKLSQILKLIAPNIKFFQIATCRYMLIDDNKYVDNLMDTIISKFSELTCLKIFETVQIVATVESRKIILIALENNYHKAISISSLKVKQI